MNQYALEQYPESQAIDYMLFLFHKLSWAVVGLLKIHMQTVYH